MNASSEPPGLRRDYRPARAFFWLCGLVILGGLLFGLVGCGAHPDQLEECGFIPPKESADPPTDPALHGLGVKRSAMACGPGTAQYPPTLNFPKAIEGYASYVSQTRCDPTAKPGVVAFRSLILKTYPCTGDYGISRACSSGGKSEHKEGRAWDWKLRYPHPAADAVIQWLLATDKYGNKHANARRVGLMYMIWNRKIWGSYSASQGWRTYTGSNPHTDHIHFSFSWDGANKKTSYWRGESVPDIKLDAKFTGQGDKGTYPASGGAYFSVCPGQSFSLTFSVQNTGNIGWKDVNKHNPGEAVRLGFKQGERLGIPTRVSLNTTSNKEVKVGEKVTFTLSAKAPNKTGVFKTEWQMVSEMVAWFGPQMWQSMNVTNKPPGHGNDCKISGKSGDCGAGTMQCDGGKLTCVPKNPGKPEVCDGKDNDCDGKTDEDNPGGGKACETLGLGLCKAGVMICLEGKLSCVAKHKPQPEICDKKDNDCDGHIDEEGVCQGTTPQEIPVPPVDAGGASTPDTGHAVDRTTSQANDQITTLDDDVSAGNVVVLDAGASNLVPRPSGCTCQTTTPTSPRHTGTWILLLLTLGWLLRRIHA